MDLATKKPYLKQINAIFPLTDEWKRFENGLGYTVIVDPRISLSMRKAPPPLLNAPSSAAQAPVKNRHPRHDEILEKVSDKYGNGIHLALAKGLLNIPYKDEKPAPPTRTPAPTLPGQCKAPPPFDLIDIPNAMEAQGWPKAAKLARRWLNGRKYIVSANSSASYDADMVDTDTLSLGWVLGFQSSKKQYAQLLDIAIYSDEAKKVLKKLLTSFMQQDRFFCGELLTWTYCKGDVQELHRQFQFQLVHVSTWSEMARRGITELMAALGDFNLYAAIATAHISTSQFNRYDSPTEWYHCTRSTVTITHLYVYAKDSYSFKDTDDKKSSQYLGHWNKYGVVISLAAKAAELANALPAIGIDVELGNYTIDNQPLRGDDYDRAIDLADSLREKDVHYPVRNRDYQQWRECHQRGGDFVIYTNPQRVKLTTPIVLQLEDVCKRIR
jgi:hypothetical protein